MKKVIIKELKDNHIQKELTRAYLDFLIDSKKSYSETKAFKLLSCNNNACMELYRHSLCICLGLDSTLAFKSLDSFIIDLCVKNLSSVLSKHSIKDLDMSVKKGFLESCMHYIVATRNQSRGY